MELVFGLIILIFSAILHEIAHGYVADHLGDPTARIMGRLTLDPRPHIDPVMTVLLPILMYISSGGSFLFGGAKPVPVDPFNLKEGRKDLALVALAGPLTNAVLAIVGASLYKIFDMIPFVFPYFVGLFLYLTVYINLLLAILNLLPIPPLDGSKVFSLALSEEQAVRFLAIGQFGMIILLFLLFFPIGSFQLGSVISRLITFGLSALGLPTGSAFTSSPI